MLTFDKKEGSFASKFHVIKLILHGFTPDEVTHLKVNEIAQPVMPEELRFFTSHFPFADYGPQDTKQVLTTSFANTDGAIVVHW
jgi:alpha-glucosidase